MKKPTPKLLAVITYVILVMAIMLAGSLMIINRHKTNTIVVPDYIQNQLNFMPVLPKANTENFNVNQDSFKYDPENKILSYTANGQSTAMTITEQAYPEVIIFDKFVGALGLYDEIETKVGTVSLTKPPTANSKQVAVLSYNNKVLVFIQAQNDLTKEQWKRVFDSL